MVTRTPRSSSTGRFEDEPAGRATVDVGAGLASTQPLLRFARLAAASFAARSAASLSTWTAASTASRLPRSKTRRR
jgi:hypothetical protein